MINYEKSTPSPECLTQQLANTGNNYRCGDVIPRLKTDFKNKCYLCEEKEPSTINVEHFIPHKGNRNLMLDWNNLFYSCGHCNNTKLADPLFDDILNCIDLNIDILEVLKFEIKPFPKEDVTVSALNDTAKVVNTATLLNRIYNGSTTLKITEGINIRDKLVKELIKFNDLLQDFYYTVGLDAEEKAKIKANIKRSISSDAPFTAFKMWVLKGNAVMRVDFADILP
jgi:hypothetical protein